MDLCIVVTNVKSGNYSSAVRPAVAERLGDRYTFIDFDLDADYVTPLSQGMAQAIAVCGGDGTLNSVLNRVRNLPVRVYYFAFGTLNERSKIHYLASTLDEEGHPLIGHVGPTLFTYVLAAGSFTSIGYSTGIKHKKRFKVLAYLFKAVAEYKVHNMPLDVSIDGDDYSGDFTLMMVLKSPRCFVFKFNRLYNPTDHGGHILLIRSPGKDNLINRIRIFFPLFRAFFIGFRKEVDHKTIVFRHFSNLDVTFAEKIPCAVDGERKNMRGYYPVSVSPLTPRLAIYPRRKPRKTK